MTVVQITKSEKFGDEKKALIILGSREYSHLRMRYTSTYLKVGEGKKIEEKERLLVPELIDMCMEGSNRDTC